MESGERLFAARSNWLSRFASEDKSRILFDIGQCVYSRAPFETAYETSSNQSTDKGGSEPFSSAMAASGVLA